MTERGDEFLPPLGDNGLPLDPNWVPPRTPAALTHLGRESEKRLAQRQKPMKNAATRLIESGRVSPLNVMENAFKIAEQECEGDAKLQLAALKAAEFIRDTVDGRPQQQIEVESRQVQAKILYLRDERAINLPKMSALEALEGICDPTSPPTSSDSRSSDSGA